MPTRQTSSSGKPKSPRIQVVLPEDLCARLTAMAELESRTVSNMARVLIQQGVQRHEQELEQLLIEYHLIITVYLKELKTMDQLL